MKQTKQLDLNDFSKEMSYLEYLQCLNPALGSLPDIAHAIDHSPDYTEPLNRIAKALEEISEELVRHR